ncbi:hypothetical protein M427DRAFT_464486 [Gonapodya prolifera JEL478]|uniref:Uncharacterized protein n=1 Tax=Gonapodya prolifera (strain JEL478) TaxID=1344416 RepID=A0A139A1W0_GONPJ|nr:hypothetical protein M427DRAFT_464486 [Gonapodya prolifera JEL478]|eukprot:KXS10724.1 hypothetical protein M427DRAFT_464486 [Gonapodya prolifera JEL478]
MDSCRGRDRVEDLLIASLTVDSAGRGPTTNTLCPRARASQQMVPNFRIVPRNHKSAAKKHMSGVFSMTVGLVSRTTSHYCTKGNPRRSCKDATSCSPSLACSAGHCSLHPFIRTHILGVMVFVATRARHFLSHKRCVQRHVHGTLLSFKKLFLLQVYCTAPRHAFTMNNLHTQRYKIDLSFSSKIQNLNSLSNLDR